VDPHRPDTAQSSSFGGTIAHGYYTLALAPRMLAEVIDLTAVGVAVNYGLDRVRCPSPLRVGSRFRGRLVLDSVERRDDGAMLALTLSFEAEGSAKPVCVAHCLVRTFSDASDHRSNERLGDWPGGPSALSA
jgi:acyl dehydratase